MKAPKGEDGFLVIERRNEGVERMTFCPDQDSMKATVAKVLKQNGGDPPPLSETDVIVIDAVRYTSG